MHAFLERFDIRVSAAYGIIATLWIVFSDALVGLVFAANQSMTVTFGLLKGLGFACVTTLALYAVLSAEWRKRISAERALFEERNLLRTLIDILPDRIYAKDSEGRFVLKNQCDLRQMGAASLQESIGKTDFDYYPLELARQYHADDQAVIQSGQPLVDHEEPVTAADGTQGWILTTKIPLRDNQGRVIGLVGIGRDITERRRVEETLTEERNLLRTLIDTIPDSIYVKDSQSRFLMNNLAHMQGLGAAPADLIGKTDFDFFPREQAERFFADDQAVIQTGQPLRHREEVVTHTVTGDRLWMDATKAPLRDRTGKIIGLVGISHNITALKQTEQALEQERTLLRTIIDNVPDYIFVKDRAGHFIASNMAHTQSVQSLRSGAIIGKTALEVYPPKLGQQFHDDDLQVLETGDALINAERRTISPDGSDRWVLTSKVPLKDAAGCVTGLIGISRDITERRQMDVILQQSEARFRLLIEESPVGIAIVRDGSPFYANQALVRLLGYRELVELEESGLSDILASDDRARIRRVFEDKRQTFPLTLELLGQHKDGSAFPLLLQLGLIPQDGGSAYIAYIMDLTERKRLEEERVNAERLRMELEKEKEVSDLKDRFIAMVSHEFRTPLSIILSSSELLLNYAERLSREKTAEFLRKIDGQVHYMVELLDGVLTIEKAHAGKVDFTPELIDIDACCQDIFENLKLADKGAHRFTLVKSGDPLGQAYLDEQLLRRILMNLLANAVKYSAEGKPIRLEVRRERTHLVFQISDEGIGIPLEDQARIYEPFQRAKNVATTHGTGLGLAIVKSSVEAHGGSIMFTSRLGVGTTFTVRLPMIGDVRNATAP